MARMQRSLFAQLNALAEEINGGAVKAASQKAAEGPTPSDPGGYQGASSHPTTSVDNNVQKATEGARSAEYEADIKKQQGALSVDSTPAMSQEGRQDEVQQNIGTTVAATGEDPAAEKDYKGTKDDPGTSHPAKTDDGEKYSSVSFKQARDVCSHLGNDILANLINFGTKQAEMPEFLQKKINEKKEKSEGESAKHEAAESPVQEAAEHKAASFAAGYELAAALGMQKEAAEANVREVCANTLREADEMADLLIGFFNTKAANDPTAEAVEGEDHESAGGSGASDAPPPEGMEAMMGGGDPAMGGEPGLDAAPPNEEEALQELGMALQELGISPEELLQLVESGAMGGGGPEGGADAGAAAGGLPPEAAGPKMANAKEIHTIGQAVINFKKAGHFQVKEARTKRSRQLRDIMKAHVRELVSR